MAYTSKQLFEIGQRGGTVSTTGMTSQDRQTTDYWVNKGKYGS